MPTIQAFCGWRYDPGKVNYADVTMPPYDVVDASMQEALYRRHDCNAVRLVLGKTRDDDNEQDNRYTRAAAHLDAWREEGLFIQDRPALYLYEQTFIVDGKPQTRRGYFARIRLAEWGQGGIYPHEKTLAGPKVDRLELMRAVRGNPGPVFGLLTDPEGGVQQALAGLVDYEPVATIEDEGVTHRLWVVDHEDKLQHVLGLSCPQQIFIADGHHRYETALTYRNEVREAMRVAGRTPPELGGLDADYALMLIVPDSDPGLVILPTHRLVYGIADFSVETLLEGCSRHFEAQPVENEAAALSALENAQAPTFTLVLPEGLYTLALKDPAVMKERAPDACAAWQELDVSVLHLLILEDLLGIDEERLLRKENIYYSKDASEATSRARASAEGVQAGFLMRPTRMDQVREVSRAGAVMPQKSTYFYPKVLSGLVFHFFW